MPWLRCTLSKKQLYNGRHGQVQPISYVCLTLDNILVVQLSISLTYYPAQYEKSHKKIVKLIHVHPGANNRAGPLGAVPVFTPHETSSYTRLDDVFRLCCSKVRFTLRPTCMVNKDPSVSQQCASAQICGSRLDALQAKLETLALPHILR